VVFDSVGSSRNIAFSGITLTNNRGTASGTGGILIYGVDGLNISNCVMLDNFDKSNPVQHQMRFGNGAPTVNAVVNGNAIKAGVLRALASAGDLTSVGTVATLVLKEHGYLVGDSLTIAGAVETNYNGAQTVASVIDQDRLNYTIVSTTSPATGSITAQTQCAGSGIFTHSTATDLVISSNRVNITNGTNLSIDSANSVISDNVCTRALNLTSNADNCMVTGNVSLSSTSSMAASDCVITGNRWNGTLNVSGDNNQMMNNRLNSVFNLSDLSGNNNDLAYNSKLSTDTGTGNEEVRTGWT